jgi:hypothetical protein
MRTSREHLRCRWRAAASRDDGQPRRVPGPRDREAATMRGSSIVPTGIGGERVDLLGVFVPDLDIAPRQPHERSSVRRVSW